MSHTEQQNGFTATDMILPNLESRCTWSVEKSSSSNNSPHTNVFRPPKTTGIMDNILDAIGWTPLVRLNRVGGDDLQCELLAKCEYFNAGGSVKDRIGARMIEEAEREGRLTPGVSTIIEPTSGNTGIGLALAAAVKGYRCIIVLPEKMSQEKVDVLKALGAEIVRTPTAAAYDTLESHIGVAQRLEREIPNAVILDQYRNAYNPVAHYDQTAQEIIEQCDGKIDMIVCGAGTGGTIAGIGRKFKELLPQCRVVGVDPVGSILAIPEELNKLAADQEAFYEVEGIGYDFIPTVLDRSVVDEWHKSSDRDALIMARRLIREEGLLCGGSSGTAVHAAVQAAKSLKRGQRCVVILPDGVRNYMTKFLNDKWMLQRRFENDNKKNSSVSSSSCWWANLTIENSIMKNRKNKSTVVCADARKTTIAEAVDIMRSNGFDQLPVLTQHGTVNAGDEQKIVAGIVTLNLLMSKLAASASAAGTGQQNSTTFNSSTSLESIMLDKFLIVRPSTTLGKLSALLADQSHFALIVNGKRGQQQQGDTKVQEQQHQLCGSEEIGEDSGSLLLEGLVGAARAALRESDLCGIVTMIDLMSFVAHENNF